MTLKPVARSPRSWSLEPVGRLVHLRWAVAELAIGIETPSAGLDAAERALAIFSQRAVALIEAIETDTDLLADACYTAGLSIAEARSSLGPAGLLRAERARALHAARRKVHHGLIVVAEALSRDGRRRSISGFDSPELSSLLSLRQIFSVFRGGLISAGEQRARLAWALEVAAAELQVLRANPLYFELSAEAQQQVEDLTARIMAWGLREPEPMLGRSLYREAMAIPSLAGDLSMHPLLVEHDEQALSELGALLANEPAGTLLEAKTLGYLSSLRGYDAELDRLELNLIYGAAGVLGALSLRVADLRIRFTPSQREAASWS